MKFRMIGRDNSLAVNGKNLKHGEETDQISARQALEFRGNLEPLDDEAKAVFSDTKKLDLKGRSSSAKQRLLDERKAVLETELASVNNELQKLQPPPAAQPVEAASAKPVATPEKK
jgi:hypothetical protein